MKIRIPNDVKTILDLLEKHKHKGYIVGGCVRDSLLRLKCNDYDITTDATISQMKKIFKNYQLIETGAKHGTLTIVINKENYEITTFRSDGNYIDHRHPEEVIFSSSIEEDLARRDFTINAMAYNEKEGLIDLFNGQSDLKSGYIKTVGDPDKRFQEDALRILRALRFSSTINFSISPLTEKAIFQNKYLLNYISKERIMNEFSKILLSNFGKDVLIQYREIFYLLFPILLQLPFYRYQERVNQIYKSKKDLSIRFALLFNDIYDNKNFLYQLNLSNKFISEVKMLWHYQRIHIPNNEISIKTLLSQIGDNNYKLLVAYQYALDFFYENEYDDYLDKFTHIKKSKQVYQLKDLAIDGIDLILLGYKNVEVGKALDFALKKVIEGQLPNDKTILKKYFSRID